MADCDIVSFPSFPTTAACNVGCGDSAEPLRVLLDPNGLGSTDSPRSIHLLLLTGEADLTSLAKASGLITRFGLSIGSSKSGIGREKTGVRGMAVSLFVP